MYRDEEIDASIQNMMPPQVRYQFDTKSGMRNLTVTFQDFQQSAASVLTTNGKAQYYVAGLAAKQAQELLILYQDAIDTLSTNVQLLGRVVKQIEDISSLQNAVASLQNMATVKSNVTSSPAYQNFVSSLNRFLSYVKPNVTYGGDIVRTPDEVRTTIPSDVEALSDRHSTLVGLIQSLSSAKSTYEATNLPEALTTGTISRVRQVLAKRAANLQSSDLAGRNEQLYETVLESLTAKGVMTGLGGFQSQSQYVAMTGDLSAHEVYPAKLTSKTGPFVIKSTNNELVVSDVGHSATVLLPATCDQSFLTISGGNPGSFDFVTTPVGIRFMSVAGPWVFGAAESLSLFFEGIDYPNRKSCTVTIPLVGAMSATDIQAAILVGLVAQGLDGIFWSDVVSNRLIVYSTGTNIGSTCSVSVSVTQEAAALLGLENGARYVGRDVDNVLTITASHPVSTSTTTDVLFTSTTMSTQDVVDRINTLLLADGAYAAAALRLDTTTNREYVDISSTDTSDSASISIDTARGDPPISSGAYRVLGTYGKRSRQDVRLQPSVIADILNTDTVFSTFASCVASTDTFYIESLDTTTSTYLKVAGTGWSTLFSGNMLVGYAEDYGTLKSFALPEKGEVEPGDTLLYVENSVQTQYPIISVSDAGYCVTSSFPSLPLAATSFDSSGADYVRILSGSYQKFATLKTGLDLWLATWSDPTSYFLELNRLVNILLSGKNPPAYAINDVVAKLSVLSAGLTSLASGLSAYSVARVEAVDRMLESYSAKGADRAFDALLECRFQDFFGMSVDDSSYAGKVRSCIKDVAREDLPVEKYDREISDRALASMDSPDYDTDFSDGPDTGVSTDKV